MRACGRTPLRRGVKKIRHSPERGECTLRYNGGGSICDAIPGMHGDLAQAVAVTVSRSRSSFARRQPPIRPVLNAQFLLPAASFYGYYCIDFFRKSKPYFAENGKFFRGICRAALTAARQGHWTGRRSPRGRAFRRGHWQADRMRPARRSAPPLSAAGSRRPAR